MPHDSWGNKNIVFFLFQLRREGRGEQPGWDPGPVPHPGGCGHLHHLCGLHTAHSSRGRRLPAQFTGGHHYISVLRIRIHRTTCFWASWIRIRIHQSQVWIRLSPGKKSKKNLDSYCFVISFWLFIFENDVHVRASVPYRNKQKKLLKKFVFSWHLGKVNDENSRIRICIRIH